MMNPSRTRKPLVGTVRVNAAHPITRGMRVCYLLNEMGGPCRDLLERGAEGVVGVGSTPTWNVSPSGPGVDLSNGNYTELSAKPAPWNLPPPFTILVWWEWLTGVSSVYGGPFDNRINGQPGFSMPSAVGVDYAYTPHLIVWDGSGEASNWSATQAGGYPPPFSHQWVWTYDGSTTPVLYASGVAQPVAAGGGGWGTPWGVVIGRAYTQTSIGQVKLVIAWDRVLSQGEARTLAQSPYCFLSQRSQRRYSVTTAVPGVLSGWRSPIGFWLGGFSAVAVVTPASGTAAIQLADTTLAAQGVVGAAPAVGAAAVTLANVTLAAQGVVLPVITGTANITLGGVTLGGSGQTGTCVSSTFAGSENPLSEGGVWTTDATAGAIKKVGGFATTVTLETTHGIAYYSGRTWANDQSSTIVRGNPDSYTDVAVGVRMSGAPNTVGYVLYGAEGVEYALQKLFSNFGGASVLATYAVAPSSTDVVKLTVVGNTLTPEINGVPFTPYVDTDSPYTSGAPGFTVFSNVADATAVASWEGCDVGAAGPVGTAAITLGATTLVAQGSAPITGTANITLGAVTLAAQGSTPVTGTAARTLGNVTLVAQGSAPSTGTAAIQLGAVTLVAQGVVLPVITGTANITLGAVTLVAQGSASATGTASITLGATTLAAQGSAPITGIAARTLGNVTLVAQGVVLPVITGTANITLGGVTLASQGAAAVTGSAAITLGATTLAAQGSAPATGTAAITLGAVTLAAQGSTPVTGTAALTLGAVTLIGQGVIGTPVIGMAALTLGNVTLAAQGSALATGTANITLGAVTLAAQGSAPSTGTAAITLGAITLAAQGTTPITGTAAITLGAVTLVAQGVVGAAPAIGTAAIILGAVALAAQGSVLATGIASITLGAVTLVAQGSAPVTGTGNITLGAVTLVAQGIVGAAPVVGTAAITLGATTLAAQGSAPSTGTASIQLGAVTLVAQGAVAAPGTGTANITLGDVTLSAQGTVSVTGTASILLGDTTLLAEGTALIRGTASITLGAITLEAHEAEPLSGAASITLGPITLAAQGIASAIEVVAPSSILITVQFGELVLNTEIHLGSIVCLVQVGAIDVVPNAHLLDPSEIIISRPQGGLIEAKSGGGQAPWAPIISHPSDPVISRRR
jgi:hypothetical protein